jgi:ComF family protein
MAPLAEALAATFAPSTCLVCARPLPWGDSRAGVCSTCWSSRIAHPPALCPHCGDPDISEPGPCLSCRTDRPLWDAATSYGPYLGALRQLVLLLKHGRDELATPLADLMREAFEAARWPVPDMLVAVPMPWLRRIRRGYNHAALLAAALARRLGVPVGRGLRRRRGTRQVGKPRSSRLRLAASSFRAVGRVGGRVVLVDDVMTTGATARVCTLALQRAGATEVYVLTLARTPLAGRFA